MPKPIYIYILSSTDRLFRSIRTLQCGQIHWTLEAGIETHPTLRQTKSQTARPTSVPLFFLKVFMQQQRQFVYIFIPYRLPEGSILSKSFALRERRPKVHSPVYLGSISSLMHISLNNIEILCLYIFCIYPFKLLHSFLGIRRELSNETPIIDWFPTTFCPILAHHQGCVYGKSSMTFVHYYFVSVGHLLFILQCCRVSF